LHSSSARGKLPLHIAAEAGASLPIVQLLLNKFPRAVIIKDARGYLPYHCARMGSVRMGVRRRACFEVVDLLLSQYPEAELIPLVRTKHTQALAAEADAAEWKAQCAHRASAQRAQHTLEASSASAAGHTAVAL
jgi:hypothetical protein